MKYVIQKSKGSFFSFSFLGKLRTKVY